MRVLLLSLLVVLTYADADFTPILKSEKAEQSFYQFLGTHYDHELYRGLDGDIEAIKDLYVENVVEEKSYVDEIELMVPSYEVDQSEFDRDFEELAVMEMPMAALGMPMASGVSDSQLPSSLNLHDLGIMHKPIYQGWCGSCGWVSGVQTLEARIALVAENHLQYSVQNFMNCDHRVCIGTVYFRVWHIARIDPFFKITSEKEMPYVRKKCKHWKQPCLCAQQMGNFTNVLDQQHVIIGPTIKAETEDNILAALQQGPLATCLSRGKKRPKPPPVGEECVFGCDHANSIIGYNETHFIMQESYGKTWGDFRNGTWVTPRNSSCSGNLTNKAYYPLIFRDHDRTNAYYTDVLVDEKALTFVDRLKHNVESDDVRNIGVAKNKCGYLGVACKGVIVLSSRAVELIADFGDAIDKGSLKAAKKTQMLVYLRHEGSGKFVAIGKNKRNKLTLKLVGKKSFASPFFTSYGRFISYDHPGYHIVNSQLVPVTKTLAAIDVMSTWTIADCNLHNSRSDYSLTVVDGVQNGTKTVGGAAFDKNSTAQRFDIGLSGRWTLRARSLGRTELRIKAGVGTLLFTKVAKNTRIEYLRWNAGQLLRNDGKPFDETMNFASGWFDLVDKDQYEVTPTDFILTKQFSDNGNPYLGIKGSKLVMTSDQTQRWTLLRGEI